MIPTIHTKQFIVLALCVGAAGCKSRPIFPIFPIHGERVVGCSDCVAESSDGNATMQTVSSDSTTKDMKLSGLLMGGKNSFRRNKTTLEENAGTETKALVNEGKITNTSSREWVAKPVVMDSSESEKKEFAQDSAQVTDLKTTSRRKSVNDEKEVSGELSFKKLTAIEKFDFGKNAVMLKTENIESSQSKMPVAETPSNVSPESKESENKPIQPEVSDEPESHVSETRSMPLAPLQPDAEPSSENSQPRPEASLSPSSTNSVEAFVTKNPTPVSTAQQYAGNLSSSLPDGFRIVNNPAETRSVPQQSTSSEADSYYNPYSGQAAPVRDQPLELEIRIKDWPTEPKQEPRAFQIQQELKTHRQLTGNVAPGIGHQEMADDRLPVDSLQSSNPMRNASHRKVFSDQFDARRVVEAERGNWVGSNEQEPVMSLNAIPKSQNVSMAPVVEVTNSKQTVPEYKSVPSNPWNQNFENHDSQRELPGRSLMPLDGNDPIRSLPPIDPENRYTNRPEQQRESLPIDR